MFFVRHPVLQPTNGHLARRLPPFPFPGLKPEEKERRGDIKEEKKRGAVEEKDKGREGSRSKLSKDKGNSREVEVEVRARVKVEEEDAEIDEIDEEEVDDEVLYITEAIDQLLGRPGARHLPAGAAAGPSRHIDQDGAEDRVGNEDVQVPNSVRRKKSRVAPSKPALPAERPSPPRIEAANNRQAARGPLPDVWEPESVSLANSIRTILGMDSVSKFNPSLVVEVGDAEYSPKTLLLPFSTPTLSTQVTDWATTGSPTLLASETFKAHGRHLAIDIETSRRSIVLLFDSTDHPTAIAAIKRYSVPRSNNSRLRGSKEVQVASTVRLRMLRAEALRHACLRYRIAVVNWIHHHEPEEQRPFEELVEDANTIARYGSLLANLGELEALFLSARRSFAG